MRILFCGVGTLGSNAALLCRNLDAQLVLLDCDRVESKNLLAQAFVRQSLGQNKAEALKLQLSSFHGRNAHALGIKLEKNNVDTVCATADLLVDCFDDPASRRLLSTFARHHQTPLVNAGLSNDGSFGMVRWEERLAPESDLHEGSDACETGKHLPLIGLVSATLAQVIQEFLTSGVRRDAHVSLGNVLSN